MTDVLSVGLIGGGIAAQALHLPALGSLAEKFRVAAIADVDPHVADEVARRHGATPFSDAFALVDDPSVDVVVIASPDAYHVDHAVAACAAKKRAVIVEKPLALHARMARAIVEASERHGVPVLVNYPHVFDYATERAREILRARGRFRYGEFRCVVGRNDQYYAELLEIIRPKSIDRWAGVITQLDYATASVEALGSEVDATDVTGRSLAVGLTIHDIPVLRRLLGEPTRVAYARFLPAEDPLSSLGYGVHAVLEYPTGSVLVQSEFTELKRIDWGFEIRRDDVQLEVAFPSPFAQAAPSRLRTFRTAQGATLEECLTDRYETGFRGLWKHVHDVVTKGAPPETPAADAVRDLELADEIANRALAERRDR